MAQPIEIYREVSMTSNYPQPKGENSALERHAGHLQQVENLKLAKK
jgi:hypothetical protein